MAEYWQEIQERAQATYSVWDMHFSGLTLGAVDAAAFAALEADLPPAAQDRDTYVQDLDEAGQTVKARTRVTNTSGSREGGVRQLTLIAP